MVPLIINPIYTLYNGYLLGISPSKELNVRGVYSIVSVREFPNEEKTWGIQPGIPGFQGIRPTVSTRAELESRYQVFGFMPMGIFFGQIIHKWW